MDQDGYGPPSMVGPECPSCDWPSGTRGGGRTTCVHCGHSWQATDLEVPADPPALDVLGAGALITERLRDYLHGPMPAGDQW
jgi:hypothetical protein